MSEILPASAAPPPRAEAVHRAIADASRANAVDFRFLLAQASVESGFDPEAKARGSSATGLFQFIESTWLSLLQRHGAKLGLGELGAAVSERNGRAQIADPAVRQQALALRSDPRIAAHMAAALAQENRAALEPVLGRAPDAAELYLAHFLGEGDARRFLAAMAQDPDASAANLFPGASAANRAIFHSADGSDRSLTQVMGVLRAKISHAMQPGAPSASIAPSAHGFAHARFANSLLPRLGPLPPIQGSASQAPLSAVLRQVFASGSDGAGPAAGEHVRQAYARLEGFGL